MLKLNCESFGEYIWYQFNTAISSSKFPASFKFDSTTQVFKNGSRNKKDNFRPVSILPTVSRISQKSLCKQIFVYFESIQI